MKQKTLFGGLITAGPILVAIVLMFVATTPGCNYDDTDCVFTISTTELPDAILGNEYNYDLEYSAEDCSWEDDTDNIYWTFLSGNLPPGISLSDEGQFSGTPYQTGEFNMTIKVTHESGTDYEELQKGFSITVVE